jgi:hypothetical protein
MDSKSYGSPPSPVTVLNRWLGDFLTGWLGILDIAKADCGYTDVDQIFSSLSQSAKICRPSTPAGMPLDAQGHDASVEISTVD